MTIQCTLNAIPKVFKKLSAGLKVPYTIIGKSCHFSAQHKCPFCGKCALIIYSQPMCFEEMNLLRVPGCIT